MKKIKNYFKMNVKWSKIIFYNTKIRIKVFACSNIVNKFMFDELNSIKKSGGQIINIIIRDVS